MKKKNIILISALSLTAVSCFFGNFSVTNENDFSTILDNVEALASSSEGGGDRIRHDTHGGKVYIKGSSFVTWEKTIGEGCMKWEQYQPLGSVNGHCYTSVKD